MDHKRVAKLRQELQNIEARINDRGGDLNGYCRHHGKGGPSIYRTHIAIRYQLRAELRYVEQLAAIGFATDGINSVYFIQSAGTGAIKIGVSADMRNRLSSLQIAHDAELTLLGTTRVYKERDLHRKFRFIRLRGEWFKPEPELIRFLRDLGFDPKDRATILAERINELQSLISQSKAV